MLDDLSRFCQRRGQISGGYPELVATTWSFSFEHIEQANPAAIELLCFCAFLDPDSILEELISIGNAHLGPVLQRVAADAFLLNEAIEELRKFSLVQRLPETRTLRVHRMVQNILKDAMHTEARPCWAERAIRATNAVFLGQEEVISWPHYQRYLPQAQACTILIQDYSFTFDEAVSLLLHTAACLRACVLNELAEALSLLVAHIWNQRLKPDLCYGASEIGNVTRLFEEQSNHDRQIGVSMPLPFPPGLLVLARGRNHRPLASL